MGGNQALRDVLIEGVMRGQQRRKNRRQHDEREDGATQHQTAMAEQAAELAAPQRCRHGQELRNAQVGGHGVII